MQRYMGLTIESVLKLQITPIGYAESDENIFECILFYYFILHSIAIYFLNFFSEICQKMTS